MEKNHQVWCSPYADLPAQFCKLQLRMSLSITVTLTYLTESQKQSNDSGICIRIYIYYTNGLFLQAQDITSITFHSEKQFWLNNDTPLIITLNFKDVEIWNKMSLVQSVKYGISKFWYKYPYETTEDNPQFIPNRYMFMITASKLDNQVSCNFEK